LLNLQHSPAAPAVGHPEANGCTEGGEALLQMAVTESSVPTITKTAPGAEPVSWYALWTHSHCEQLVYEQLLHKGFCALLPTMDVWSSRRGKRRLISTPMFPGYLFLRRAMDKTSYVEVSKCRGLVTVLGESWDRLSAIPDDEMAAIEQVAAAREPVLPYPYLKEGQRARITGGPLAGLEGLLVATRPQQGMLVISLHLLHRSVAVVIDGTDVVPA
jgi:transcription antitermination factor NusG